VLVTGKSHKLCHYFGTLAIAHFVNYIKLTSFMSCMRYWLASFWSEFSWDFKRSVTEMHQLCCHGNILVLLLAAYSLSRPMWSRYRALCVCLWPDLACTGETVAGYSYCYLLPEGRRDQARIGLLTVLHDQIGQIVTLISA